MTATPLPSDDPTDRDGIGHDRAGHDTAGLDEAARRVDLAMERAELLDATGRRVALDLKAAVEGFHREGLLRLVRGLRADPRGRELLYDLVDDPVVYALLVMHGIVRADPTTLAQRALAAVRPQVEAEGGQVELVAVEPPVARVRLSTGGGCASGGCGCGDGSDGGGHTRLREIVERALVAGVPAVQQVEVVAQRPVTVIPLSALTVRPR